MKDLYSRMGEALRFLTLHLKTPSQHIQELRKKGKEIVHWTEKSGHPLLEKEAKEFFQTLEHFLSHPDDKALAERVLKKAFHLEQQTREF